MARHFVRAYSFQMDRSIPSIPFPVCRSSASNRTPPNFDGQIIRCNNCRDIEISGSVLAELQSLDRTARAVALQKARSLSQPGSRPVITTACL